MTFDHPFEEGTTLDRFIFETTQAHPEATGQFATLLQQVSLAARMVSSRVNRAGLAGMLGATGEVNVQGEFVQKLDEYANNTFKKALEHPGVVAAIASEEDERPFYPPDRFRSGRYVFCMDPLDGSSNIDVNATIGTIFAIFRRRSPEGTRAGMDDILRSGRDIVAAGYVIYGSGTVLVIAAGSGVHGFTLDPNVGEFFLSHPDIRLAPSARTYSINEGYAASWDPRLRQWIEGLKSSGDGWKARYIGSLVADFHRNLLKGGIFLYPATRSSPQGKLRLLYEAMPLAFIAEAAGGAATDGHRPILDLEATALHQRAPLFIGNREEVAAVTELLSQP
ncbi:MAG: class 1 fructose-bisphosphatase [Deltaproteobacteria bacterium]|nr:MAG: class 1 fructose-bisphosphatase [Deltaproteobacteria bacterium]